MLILRLRQSEIALADGRLDEAFQLVHQHNLASHRRGQRLVTHLAERFVKRGNEHLKAARFSEAFTDGEKAFKLAGSLPDVVALRAAAADAMSNLQRQEQRRRQLVGDARRQVDQGRLDAGSQLLAAAPADVTRVQLLRQDIGDRRAQAAAAIRAAHSAQDRGELHLAAEQIVTAHAADPHDSAISNFKSEIINKLRDQIRTCLNEGHLHRAQDLLPRLHRLETDSPETRELSNILTQLQSAWAHIAATDYGQARITLARLIPLVSDARWIKTVITHLEQAEQAITQIHTGPLAWLNPDSPRSTTARIIPETQAPLPAQPHMPAHLPSQLLLHADGIGSFLILRQPTITIGPISSRDAHDIALIADPNLPSLRVQRIEDDYFLSTQPGSKPKLLTNGEKLELSPRCRLTFAIPNPASTSAVLELTGAKLPRSDVRRVILMDQDLILGPGSLAHIPAHTLIEPLVLHLRQGQIFCQTRHPILVNDRPLDPRHPLPLSTTIKIAQLSFVLAPISADKR